MRSKCQFLQFLLALGLAALAWVSTVSCSTASWRLLSSGDHSHTLGIFSVSFSDRSNGWLVTPAQLRRTSNGGHSWIDTRSREDETYLDMTWVDGRTGWIVGSQNKNGTRSALILRTIDAGISWQEQRVEGAQRLTSITFSGRNLGWVAGVGVIANTTDAGETWAVQYTGSESILWSIANLDSQRAFAVGESGTILFTVDGGITWNRKPTELTSTLFRVRVFDHSGWIVGSDGVLLRTRDGGASWQHVSVATTQALTDIYISGKNGWLVGTEGTILRSEDGGDSWERYKSPTSNSLLRLFFLSADQGWAVGASGTILSYSD